MQLVPHLFHRREVVALFLDLDETALTLTDLALPPLVALRGAPVPAASTAAAASAATYVSPQTRLDVLREALVAFIGAKLRSVPDTALLSFVLYAIRRSDAERGGRDGHGAHATTEELLAPGLAGAAGGRAVQAAILGLQPSLWSSRATDGLPSADAAASASPAGYAAVVQCLQRLLREAEHGTRQPPDPATSCASKSVSAAVSANTSFAPLRAVSSSATNVSNGPHPPASQWRSTSTTTAAVSDTCVVVHGIVLRSRRAALTTAAPPAPSAVAMPRCWLDIVSLSPLQSCPPDAPSCPSPRPAGVGAGTAGTAAAVAAATPQSPLQPLLSTEVHLDDGCASAVLDPVELSGIGHRGLALGPALARLTAPQERRTAAFVRRRLAVVDASASAAAATPPVSITDCAAPCSGSAPHTTSATAAPALGERQQQPKKRSSGGSKTHATAATAAAAAAATTRGAPAPLVSPPQQHASPTRSPWSAFPELQAHHGSGSGAGPVSPPTAGRPAAPAGVVLVSPPLPTVVAQRRPVFASYAASPPPAKQQPQQQANPRRPNVSSSSTGGAAESVEVPEPLRMMDVGRDGVVDLAVARRYSAVDDESPGNSPKAAEGTAALPLHRAATHSTAPPRRRTHQAPSAGGHSPEKGSGRQQPELPPQRHGEPGVRGGGGGGVMAATTQAPLSSLAAASQHPHAVEPPGSPRAMAMPNHFSAPLPLAHPHSLTAPRGGAVRGSHAGRPTDSASSAVGGDGSLSVTPPTHPRSPTKRLS
ncbi:hypothetical protein NESM_000342700 [Novymonas esmeraldas]|uniref:Uncharacterized protein n=1 Tax=Novymonas esmeraldas TaxID=1808958 RepID=A0AAW0ELX4_9TRYP